MSKKVNLKTKIASCFIALTMVLGSYAGILSYVVNDVVSQVQAGPSHDGNEPNNQGERNDLLSGGSIRVVSGNPTDTSNNPWSDWSGVQTGTISHTSGAPTVGYGWKLNLASGSHNNFGKSSISGGCCASHAGGLCRDLFVDEAKNHHALYQETTSVKYQWQSRTWIQATDYTWNKQAEGTTAASESGSYKYVAGRCYREWRFRAWDPSCSSWDYAVDHIDDTITIDEDDADYHFEVWEDGSWERRSKWPANGSSEGQYTLSTSEGRLVFNFKGHTWNISLPGYACGGEMNGSGGHISFQQSDGSYGTLHALPYTWDGITLSASWRDAWAEVAQHCIHDAMDDIFSRVRGLYANDYSGIKSTRNNIHLSGSTLVIDFAIVLYKYPQVGVWNARAWQWAGSFLNFKKNVDANSCIPDGYINDNVYRGFRDAEYPVNFGIYTDAACTQAYKSPDGKTWDNIRVTRDGNVSPTALLLLNSSNMTRGVYYVKEWDDGRNTDFSAYTISGSGMTITATETPGVWKVEFGVNECGKTFSATATNDILRADPGVRVQKHYKGTKQPVEGALMMVRRYDMSFVPDQDTANQLIAFQTLTPAAAAAIGTHNTSIQNGSSHTYSGAQRVDYYSEASLTATNVLFPLSVNSFKTVMNERYDQAVSWTNGKSDLILSHTNDDGQTSAPRQVNTWYIKTDETGRVNLRDLTNIQNNYVSEGSDPLPMIGDALAWPAGVYVISEVQGTDAYYLNPATTLIYIVATGDETATAYLDSNSVYYNGQTGAIDNTWKSIDVAGTPESADDYGADEDMPKLGSFTLEKNNEDIVQTVGRDEADENGNDADIDVDANNDEVIVRGQLYATSITGNDFRYYSKGVTEQDDPDIYIKDFAGTCSVTEPRLVFGADVTLGSREEGNYIENGEIYLIRHTDKETGNIRYEWRGADLSITPGDYLFVETWAADGFLLNYPDLSNAFHITVEPGARSQYMNYQGGTNPNDLTTYDATGNADDPMNNKPIHNSIVIEKVDEDFDIYDGRVGGLADGTAQGDAYLYAAFAVYNMSDNAAVIAETSTASFTDRVAKNGGLVGYVFTDGRGYGNVIYRMPGGTDEFPATRNEKTGEYTLKSGAVAVTLPYGTYAVEEYEQPVGYVAIDADFNRVHGRTASATNREWVVVRSEDDAPTDFTYAIVTNAEGDYDVANDEVIRGGIEVQKSDWDVLVKGLKLEPEGNGAWDDIGFIIYNESRQPVWVDLNGNGTRETREIFDVGAAIVSSDNKYTVKPEYTFTLDANGHFQSPTEWLPYGSYKIAEMTDEASTTKTGYHMLGSEADGGVRHFTIRKDNTIEDANKFILKGENDGSYIYADDATFANPVKRGGIVVTKYNKDDKTQIAQGDASLAGAQFAIWNTSDHYVVVDQNGDGILSDAERMYPINPCTEKQIDEAIANGLASRTNSTGATEWYGVDNAGNEIISACVIVTGATGVAQTSAIALPFGDYIVREVLSSEGYHIDLNFNMHVILTDEVTSATELDATSDARSEYAIPVDTYATINRAANVCVRDGRLVDMTGVGSRYAGSTDGHIDGRYAAEPTEYRSSVYEAPIRGSFVLQKVDEDDYEAYKNGETLYVNSQGKYVIEAQGDATFGEATFQVINRSEDAVYTLTYDAAGNEVLTKVDVGEIVWTFKTDGNGYYEAPDDLLPYGTYEIQEVSPSQGYKLTTQKNITFTVGRNENGSAETITRNEELDRSNTENDLAFDIPGYTITRIDGARYEVRNTATGKLVTNASFTISNGMDDGIYIFVNGVNGVTDVQKFEPGEQIFSVKTDSKGQFVMRQLTAHMEGTDYRCGTKYTFAGDINGTCTVTLAKYTVRFTANLTTKTVYDKYPIEEPIIRGGVNVLKVDEDKYSDAAEMQSPSGDATLGGAVFSIYNISDRYTWVTDEQNNWRRTHAATTDGKWISQDDVDSDEIYDPDEEQTRAGVDKINAVTSSGMVNSANTVTSEDGSYTQDIAAFNGATSQDVIDKYHGNDVARLGNNDIWDLVNGQTPVKQIVTDDLGFATTGPNDLPYGTYLIIETESSRGYMLPRCWYRIVEVREDGHTYTWEETNTAYTPNVDTQVTMEPVIRGDVQIFKQDAELKESNSLMAGGLEGIEFKIYNVSDNAIYLWELTGYRNEPLVDTTDSKYNTPTKIINSTLFNPTSSRGWTDMDSEPSNYVATIVTHWNPSLQAYTAETYVTNPDGSKKDVNDDGTTIRGALPYGTYLIRESKTNTVYEFTDGKPWIFQIREEGQVQQCGLQSGDTIGISDAHEIIFVNQIERNDIWFNKIGDGDSIRMDTMWVIKNEDTGERHVIVTNSGSDDDNTGNGTYESGADVNPHTYETNANDKFLAYIDANGLLNTDTQVISEADLLANGNEDGKAVAITMGARDHHVVTDHVVQPGQKDPVEVVVSDDGLNNQGMGYAVYDAGTWFGFCEFTAYGEGQSPSQYVLNGKAMEEVIVMDETTGKPIVLHWADPDDSLKALPYGHYTISEVRTDTNIGYGLQSYSFTINNSNTDRSAWANEVQGHDREVDLGTITDDKAPEYFVETEMIDAATNSHIGLAKSGSVLNETVTYSTTGTVDFGKKFKVEADLYVAQQNEDGTWSVVGDPIAHAASDEFTLNSFFGQKTVTFNVDASELAGKTVVSYAYLYKVGSDSAVASHKDAGDALEQVSYPQVTTTFAAALTGDKDVPVGANVVLVDKVHATNLAPNVRYAVSGQLMTVDAEGNATAVLGADGKAIVATSAYEFVTETSHDFELVFNGVNTDGYEGKYFVAYAQLLVNDVVVAEHNDIADLDETVYVPRIETDAVDGISGDQQGVYTTTAQIKDTITFENLTVGKTYTAQGTLYERLADGSVVPVMVEGAEGETAVVTGLAEFVPTERNGQVTVTFDFDSTKYAGKDIVVFEVVYAGSVNDEGVTSVADLIAIANHSDANDERQMIHYPDMSTQANDANTLTQSAMAITEAGIVDTISYKNLIVGNSYIFEGTLMTKDAEGNAVAVTDASGNPITVRSEAFTPTEKNGTYDMKFTFDASAYAGKSIVVFEKLLSGKNPDIVYVTHEDINDENQTIHFPEIGTTAHDASTGDEVGYANENTTLVDTVHFKNLVPGLTYRVVGTIYDRETGLPIMEANGAAQVEAPAQDTAETTPAPETTTETSDTTAPADPQTGDEDYQDDTDVDLTPATSTKNGEGYITAEATFVAPSADGDVDVTFTFDARAFKNRDIVCYETLYLVVDSENVVITEDTVNTTEYKMAEHSDINDEGQTVHYPDVFTEAVVKDTKLHESFAGENVTITDTVHCKNLVIGKEYTLHGTLVDKETGEIIIDASGVAVSADLTFTAEEKDCDKLLDFTFDASALRGHTVVAFETLYHEGKVVAVHTDLSDTAQTVFFPDLQTIATSAVSGNKVLEPIDVETVRDEVKYSNVIIGHKYRIEGQLIDKETGEPILTADNKICAASVEFTAEVTSGSVFVDFGQIKMADFAGKSIVVYEKLYNIDGENAVILVDDNRIDNTDETVRVTNPTVTTVLAETDTGSKCIAPEQTVKLTDTIQYTDIVPGNHYVIVSTLVDQETGTTLKDDSGKDLVVEAEITPENETASVTVNFTFEGKTLEGKVAVAFNELYRVIDGQRYLVVSEKNLENKDQTVTFPVIGTTATDATNGTHTLAFSERAIIHDVVEYRGLEIGKLYTVTGTPYFKDNGQPVPGVDPVTVTFTASASYGTVIVEVPVNTLTLAGRQIVMFEEVKYEGKTVCVHADLNDENQLVTVCAIGTVLADANGAKTVQPTTVTLVDTVKFEGLTPGETYILSGEIIDKGTGTGTNVTVTPAPTSGATATPTPTVVPTGDDDTDENGGADATPTSDQSGFKPLDVDPTAATPTPTGAPADTTPAPTATVTPTPAPTTAPVAGSTDGNYKVVARNSIEFTPTSANGSVQISFQVDASQLNGHSLVAFETVTTKSGQLVGEHKDINDKDQTIVVTNKPNVRTGVTMFAIVFATIAGIAAAVYGAYVAIVLKKRKTPKTEDSEG